MTDTHPTAPYDELRTLHSLIHQPSYALVYPETEEELGFPVAQRVQKYIRHQQLKLLEELEAEAIYGHLAVPNCTEFVPLTVITKKKERL